MTAPATIEQETATQFISMFLASYDLPFQILSPTPYPGKSASGWTRKTSIAWWMPSASATGSGNAARPWNNSGPPSTKNAG